MERERKMRLLTLARDLSFDWLRGLVLCQIIPLLTIDALLIYDTCRFAPALSVLFGTVDQMMNVTVQKDILLAKAFVPFTLGLTFLSFIAHLAIERIVERNLRRLESPAGEKSSQR